MRLKSSRSTFLGLCVAISAQALTAFQAKRRLPCSTTRNVDQRSGQISPLQLLAKNDAVEPKPAKPRVNKAVREIVQYVIQEKYPGHATPATNWTRFRHYVYVNDEKLSLDHVKQVVGYIEELFPDDRDLQVSVLQRSPSVLRHPVDTFLRPTVDFLRRRYGTNGYTEAVRRYQDILLKKDKGYNVFPFSVSVAVYLAEQLDMSPTAISKLQQKDPLLFQPPLHKIEAVVSFFEQIMLRGNVTEQAIQTTVAKFIQFAPRAFFLSVPDILEPKLDYFQSACLMQATEVTKLLVSKRGGILLFLLSIENNVKPKIAYLSQIIAFGEEGGDMKHCILCFPEIVHYPVPFLQSKVEYFDSLDPPTYCEMGKRVPSQGLAAKVLRWAAPVFGMSLADQIIPKVEFLSGVWGVSVAANMGDRYCLAALLGETTAILGCSLEDNIKPTLQFFNRTGYTTLDSEWNLVQGVDYSRLIRGREITMSLYNRLLPRWLFVRTKYNNATETLPTPLIPREILVSAADAKFCGFYSISREDYENFKAEVIPRLKDSPEVEAWLKTGQPVELELGTSRIMLDS